jgi:uracil-DNA glycosylase
MSTVTSAADFIPPDAKDLESLRRAALSCRGCELWSRATTTVFGEGPASARVVMVGEQPGDVEDTRGAPFVGPAGRVLDDALDRAGIPRSDVYVTNAVKHFKWEPYAGGRRRLHKKPSRAEVRACHPWLDAEVAVIKPKLVCCLGVTAAESVIGPGVRVGEARGRLIALPGGGQAMVTVHPSSVLRGPPEEREQAMSAFVTDLKMAAAYLVG